ncbi:MAG: hypothetical protein IKM40_04315 [Clostridia bacterium]|nr:hypothetical protein [Clostridia bacterium]
MARVNVSARTVAYKSAIYGALLFLIGTAQVTFFSKINILGATPDLLLGALLVIAMLDDERVSAVCGIISGVIYVSLGTTTLPFYLIFSFLCACVLPVVSRLLFGKNYPSFLALSVITFSFKAAYNLALIFIGGGYGLFASLGSAVIPEFISSLVFTSVSYIIFAPTARAINKRSTSRKENLSK